MTALIQGYSFKLVARLGLAANVPTLVEGEIGFDTDMKVFRVGDDTSTPPRVPTTKSLGAFDFSLSDYFKFKEIQLPDGGTVDGVDISKINVSNGFLVRKANNDFQSVSFASGDGTIQITNGSGIGGNVDLRVSPDLLADLIGGGYLTEVITSDRFTGDGTALTPLDIKASSETQVGAMRIATQAEFDAGLLSTVAVVPYHLTHFASDSPIAIYITEIVQQNLDIAVDDTLTGSGKTGDPLSVVSSSTSNKGIVQLATQAEADAGVSAVKSLTPAILKNLTAGSPTVEALKLLLGNTETVDLGDVRMTGPGVVGRVDGLIDQPPQVLPFLTPAEFKLTDSVHDNKVVRQASIKDWFPKGALKPISINSLVDLPDPVLVGNGGMVYYTPLNVLLMSDGVSKYSIIGGLQNNPQDLWKYVTNVSYAGSNAVLTLDNTGLYKYTIALQSTTGMISFTGASYAAVVEAYLGSAWVDISAYIGPQWTVVRGWSGSVYNNYLEDFYVPVPIELRCIEGYLYVVNGGAILDGGSFPTLNRGAQYTVFKGINDAVKVGSAKWDGRIRSATPWYVKSYAKLTVADLS